MSVNVDLFNQTFDGLELSVRTVTVDGEVWFVGRDVANCLDYKDFAQALRKNIDPEDKQSIKDLLIPVSETGSEILSNLGIKRGPEEKSIMINESGLYSLILSSQKPIAKVFKRWVTSVVLPTIRKYGNYTFGEETLSDNLRDKHHDSVNESVESIKNELHDLKELLSGKMFISDSLITVSKSDARRDGIDMNAYADILSKIVDKRIGRNILFTAFRELGYFTGSLANDEYTDPDQPDYWYFNNINKFKAPKKVHITELGANMLKYQVIEHIFDTKVAQKVFNSDKIRFK